MQRNPEKVKEEEKEKKKKKREEERKNSATLDQRKRKEERKMKMFVEKKADEEASKAGSHVLHRQWVHACGCSYKMPLKTELWKLKTPKTCFQFP